MSSPSKSSKSQGNTGRNQPAKSPTPARLDALIEEALVDAYDEGEQASGFCCVIEDSVKFPFETTLLGMAVSVTGVDTNASGEDLVAIVRRGKYTQKVPLTDLPLPVPLPEGGEWLLAFRKWAEGTRGDPVWDDEGDAGEEEHEGEE